MKSLELEKNKCYNHILRERQQAEQNIRNIDEELEGIDHDITKILVDIEDNYETVFSIEQDMYLTVVGQYRKQQQEFQEQLGGILLAPIEMRRI